MSPRESRTAPQSPTPKRRRPLDERILITVASTVGGFFGGAFLGSALEPPCGCDDPGLKGMVIGAFAGAGSLGYLGWRLSR